MGIRFACPNGHRLNVKSFLAGKRGICPDCGARFTIPTETIPGFEKSQRQTSTEGTAVKNSAGQAPISDASQAAGAVPVSQPAQPGESADDLEAGAAHGSTPSGQQPSSAPLATADVENDLQTGGSKTAAGSHTQSTEWYVQIADGQRFGPADTRAMRDWILEGRIAPNNLVHQRGWPTWRTAADVFPELSSAMPVSRDRTSPEELVVDGTPRMDRYRGRQAARSRLFAIVATLGIMSVVLLATLIYVVRR